MYLVIPCGVDINNEQCKWVSTAVDQGYFD
jgi:hypothetical protein